MDEFIAGLPPRHQAAIDDQISRVNALLTVARPHLPFPYSSQVDGELRELRCHYGSTLYRILYRRSRQLVVLLHIFNKRTRTVPGEDTEIARARWVDFERRMNAVPRAPPRAAGHDAPPPSRG